MTTTLAARPCVFTSPTVQIFCYYLVRFSFKIDNDLLCFLRLLNYIVHVFEYAEAKS